MILPQAMSKAHRFKARGKFCWGNARAGILSRSLAICEFFPLPCFSLRVFHAATMLGQHPQLVIPSPTVSLPVVGSIILSLFAQIPKTRGARNIKSKQDMLSQCPIPAYREFCGLQFAACPVL